MQNNQDKNNNAERPSKPYDNPRIFWDVDYAKMDLEKKASFIIERVFERGDVEDIRMCRRYYGDGKISESLLQAKWLSLKTIYFAAALFNHKLTDFRCYLQIRLSPELTSY